MHVFRAARPPPPPLAGGSDCWSQMMDCTETGSRGGEGGAIPESAIYRESIKVRLGAALETPILYYNSEKYI